MVGGNKQNILLLRSINKFRNSLIQFVQRIRVTFRVVSVSVQHIKINKVCEYNSLKIILHIIKGFLKALHVVFCMNRFVYSFSVEYIFYFSHRLDNQTLAYSYIQQGGFDWVD